MVETVNGMLIKHYLWLFPKVKLEHRLEAIILSKFMKKIQKLYNSKKDLDQQPSYFKDVEELLRLDQLL